MINKFIACNWRRIRGPRRGTQSERERLKKIKMMHRCCYLRCDCVMEVCWLAAAPRQLRRHIIAFFLLCLYQNRRRHGICICKPWHSDDMDNKEEERDRELLQWIFAMTRDVQQQPTFHYKLITWYSNSLHFHLLYLSTSIVIYDFHLFDLVLARASSSLSHSLSVYNFLMWICHNSTKSFH